MKVRELLTTIDRLRPNAYTDEEKLHFLNTIEGRIYKEIVEKAEPPKPPPLPLIEEDETETEESETEETETEETKPDEQEKKKEPLPPRPHCFKPFREGDEEKDLIVSIPYTDIYIYYLAAMIDFYNGDSGRYNDTMVLFNQAWEDYAAYYRATHKPKQTNLTGMLPHHGYAEGGGWFDETAKIKRQPPCR